MKNAHFQVTDKDSPPTKWKEVAWNGIRFLAPDDWQPAKIGPRYLVFEDERGPALEVKWNRVRGTFAPEDYLRRLAARQGKGLAKPVSERALPAAWSQALGDHEVTCFSWHGGTVGGTGVIVYCPTCRNATLIQFYHTNFRRRQAVPQRLLTSFRDHRGDQKVRWAVFDIRATMPDHFSLVRHRFEPGEFELSFVSRRQKIGLYRWGPASILLSRRDLAEFAATRFSLAREDSHLRIQPDGKAVEWKRTPPCAGWAKWWARLRFKPSVKRLRLWHLEKHNRILGVAAETDSPSNAAIFDSICAEYESL